MTETDTTQRDELAQRIASHLWECSAYMTGVYRHDEHDRWIEGDVDRVADAVRPVLYAELSEWQRMQAEGFLVEQRARQAAEAEVQRLQAELQDERKGGPR